MSNFNELFYIFKRVQTSTIPLTVRSILTVEYYVDDEKFIDVLSNFMGNIFEKYEITTYSQFCEAIEDKKNEYDSVFESYLMLSKEKCEMKHKLYSIDMTLNNFIGNIKSTKLNPVDNVVHNNVSDGNIKFSYIKKGTDTSKDKGSILHYMDKVKPKEKPREKPNETLNDYSVFINYMNRYGYNVIDAEDLKFSVKSYTNKSVEYNIWHDCVCRCFKCDCPSYHYSSQDNPGFKCKHLNHFINVYDKF
jgi:hypothetical protein